MAIDTACPTCGKHYALDEKLTGERARCACGAMFTVAAAASADVYDYVDAPPTTTRVGPPLPRPAAAVPPTPRMTPPPQAGNGRTIAIGVAALVVFVVGIAVFQRVKSRQAAAYLDSIATFAPLAPIADFPADSPWRPRGGGGMKQQYLDVRNAAGLTTRLVVILPSDASGARPLPCVFVAPAGSRMFHGMTLAPEDEREMTPYVAAGMAAIGYSIGGPLADRDIDNAGVARGAFRTFRQSQGGLVDAEAAIAYALARRPEIDPNKLFVAGHSSAASLALLVAAKDSRIRACCAYAPATDLIARNAGHIRELEEYLPGYERFSRDISPANLPNPEARVFLFSALDDTNVPTAEVAAYAKRLGPTARLLTAPRGGHFESMMRQGMPAGVEFLTTLASGPIQTRK